MHWLDGGGIKAQLRRAIRSNSEYPMQHLQPMHCCECKMCCQVCRCCHWATCIPHLSSRMSIAEVIAHGLDMQCKT